MYCEELDRLLEAHSTLTLEFFRQDVRTQGWYANTGEWAHECQKLQAVEQELDRVAADVLDHLRQHGCAGSNDLTTPRLRSGQAPATKEHEAVQG